MHCSARMTKARTVIPGKSYLMTRRCAQREYLLTPSADLNDLFFYLLAVAQERYGIGVHAFVAMSNHYHLLVTDERGVLPDFAQWFHSSSAKKINAYRGRSEALWGPDTYSRVELDSAEDAFRKLLYIYANPVQAGLVARSREWPGAMTEPLPRGAYRVSVERPAAFFTRRSSLPERATLRVTPPPALREVEAGELGRQLRAEVRRKEREVARRLRQEGRKVVGARRIYCQRPTRSPRTDAGKYGSKPTIAAVDRWRRQELLERDRYWLEQYEIALERHMAGDSTVVFPYGTWWRWRFGGAKKAAEPPGAG